MKNEMTSTQPPHAQHPLASDIISMISRYTPRMEEKKLRITVLELCKHIDTMGIEYCASHSSIPPTMKPGHCGYERVVCRVFNPITDDECCQATQCRSDTRKQPSAEQRIEKAEKACVRDFIFYRIKGGIFEPDLVTINDAPGIHHAIRMLKERGFDPNLYDVMRIGKFEEFPDDYEN